MELPVRVHLSEKHDIACCRPGKWGNPFSHKEGSLAQFKTNNREESLQKHKEWLNKNEELLSQLSQLSGKRLACWCRPNQKCHVDNLIEKFKEINFGLF